MEKNTMVKVSNRSSGTVVYTVPEMHVTRVFSEREVKDVPFGELQAVSYQPGGRELLYHYLMVHDEEALRALINADEEPEYWLTEDKIPVWINSSTIEEFTDALNFAPDGVKELIKKYAVTVPLNDIRKCDLIKEKLEFDVETAIKNDKADKEADNDTKNIVKKERLSTPKERKTTPNYRIIKPSPTK